MQANQKELERSFVERFIDVLNARSDDKYRICDLLEGEPYNKIDAIICSGDIEIPLQITQAIADEPNWRDGRLTDTKKPFTSPGEDMANIVAQINNSIEKKVSNHRQASGPISLLLVSDNIFGHSESEILLASKTLQDRWQTQSVFDNIWLLYTSDESNLRTDRLIKIY